MDKKTWANLHQCFRENSAEALQQSFQFHLRYTQAKDEYSATAHDLYNSIAYAVRDRLVDKWTETQESYYDQDVKRVYFLSMEYLVGRTLSNYMIDLEIRPEIKQALKALGHELEEIEDNDVEPGLGNGGLGRLATCFQNSLATLSLPACGYGIRYEFGIFYQKIRNGFQTETSDNWNRRGNPWEIPRPELMFPVKFFGKVVESKSPTGQPVYEWVDARDDVMAMAYDIPVPGYKCETVNTLRLWSAKSTRELDFEFFNTGDYLRSVSLKADTENISKVLYPNDNIDQGKELRLKQEYFFVSASLQDIIRRYKKNHPTFDQFSEKVAVQLNDTHPSLAVPELMRLLIDVEKLSWERAWKITVETFGFTNHTILPEAMEKWPVHLMEYLLPRHLQIIYQINDHFLKQIRADFPGNDELARQVSIVQETPERSIRMAHLAIVGSHKTNGVARLHTEILKNRVFKPFYQIFSDRFHNKTNGITPRLWLKTCNPELAELITSIIGDQWITQLDELKKLVPLADDAAFREQWATIKMNNKKNLAKYIDCLLGISVNVDSIFDVQIKRIHEYKRQLLNILHVVALYNRIKDGKGDGLVPRTVIFSGKAAPGYHQAKLIIKLIHSVGDKVNHDPDVGDLLKVVFIPNYSVSKAEKIIPSADLSEQISTAGWEASGTGNMKLALNGALTIGTLDGANIEIMEEVGKENIFIFGLEVEDVQKLDQDGYQPRDFYDKNQTLKRALEMIRSGHFSPEDPALFHPIVNALLSGDTFKVMADFEAYCQCQENVAKEYADPKLWFKKSILNSANMGKFSSDRTIQEYSRDVWNIQPVRRS